MTRILGIDFGTRRVGAAVSDPGRSIAFPLEIYERRGVDADARHYRELVEENDVDRIVVGLPLHTSGREGDLAARARAFGDWLTAVTGRPVIYFDERYTTVEAEHRLLDAGLTRQKRKALRDKLAAQIMLQSYLDAGCPETEAAAAPARRLRRGKSVTTLIIGCGYLGQRLGSTADRTAARACLRYGSVGRPRSRSGRPGHRAGDRRRAGTRLALERLPQVVTCFTVSALTARPVPRCGAVYVDGLQNVLSSLAAHGHAVGLRQLDGRLRPDRRRMGRRIVVRQSPARIGQGVPRGRGPRPRSWAKTADRDVSGGHLAIRRALRAGSAGTPVDSRARRADSRRSGQIPEPGPHRRRGPGCSRWPWQPPAPNCCTLSSDDRPVTRQEYYSRMATLLGTPPTPLRAPATGQPRIRPRRDQQANR